MEFADYERRLSTLQGTLQLIQQAYLGTSERALLVLEGWDTAGKGGLIRRLGWALDPRSFKVHPIAAPDEHERAQHYLQRFWSRLPAKGEIVAFDRSWYGRVLVERVEGFATTKEWRRAYREINEFECVLINSGVRLVKLFLHITPDEQIRRFRDRLVDPVKRWKLSYDDFRNHARSSDYVTAIEDMMAETSTKHAPWHLIPANSKPYRPDCGVSHPCGQARQERLTRATSPRCRSARTRDSRARPLRRRCRARIPARQAKGKGSESRALKPPTIHAPAPLPPVSRARS